jgi:GNAT superfamily N-acetyltransferase
VRETCAKDYSAVQLDAWIARATPARWQQLLSGDLHFIAAVNQTSGELAGFASINPDGYLHSMFVRPGYQKKGVASFMLHALEDWVMRFQASDIYSEVSITALPFSFMAKSINRLPNPFPCSCGATKSISIISLLNPIKAVILLSRLRKQYKSTPGR